MTLQTAIGYLIALALPLWLLVELAVSQKGTFTRSEAKGQRERATRVSRPAAAPTVARGGKMKSVLPRRAA